MTPVITEEITAYYCISIECNNDMTSVMTKKIEHVCAHTQHQLLPIMGLVNFTQQIAIKHNRHNNEHMHNIRRITYLNKTVPNSLSHPQHPHATYNINE